MKKVLLAFLLLSCGWLCAQETWRPLGPDDYNQASYEAVLNSRTIARNGKIYTMNKQSVPFAFNEWLTVNYFDGTRWTQIGYWPTDDVSDGGNTRVEYDIAVDSNNIPYIIFTDSQNQYKGCVKKYIGGSWVSVGTTFITTGRIDSGRIAMDSGNQPVIFYREKIGTGPITAYAKKFDGSNWNQLGTAGFVSTSGGNTQSGSPQSGGSAVLALDHNDTPYLYYIKTSGVNAVVKFTGGVWSDVGVADFGVFLTFLQHNIAFDAANTPYIAYVTNEYDSVVRKFDGTNWVTVGSAPITFPEGICGDLAIAPDGAPHVTVHISQTPGASVYRFDGNAWQFVGTPYFANSAYSLTFDGNDLITGYHDSSNGRFTTVRKRNGDNWDLVGDIRSSLGEVWYTSLALDSNNVPYAAYQNEDWEDKLSVKKFNGTQWEYVGPEFLSATAAYGMQMAVDNNNVPHVVYASSSAVSVIKFNGTSWEFVGTQGFAPQCGSNLDLKFSSTNQPYVSFDRGNGTGALGKANVMRFNGTAWEQVGAVNFSQSQTHFLRLALDNNDVPYVCYSDEFAGERLSVMKFNGTTWNNVGAPGFTWATVAFPVIGFDGNNMLYAAYRDHDFDADRKISVSKFNGTSWSLVGPQGFSEPIGSLGLAFDTNNAPYVAYSEEFELYRYRASVKKFNGSAWVQVGDAMFTPGDIRYVEIAVGSNNVPYVVYGSNSGLFGKYYGEATLSTESASKNTTALSIIPNPVRDKFSIQSERVIQNVTIYDNLGKMVLFVAYDREIDLSALSEGLYFAKIQTESGIQNVKIIKM